jgi:hypothetical protein
LIHMALALTAASTLGFYGGNLVPPEGASWEAKPWSSSEISDASGLKVLAKKLNPAVGFWDPLDIASKTKEEIAWFRHAEIKHGRVAMAAFIGYTVQSLGVHFPGNLQQTPSTVTFADLSAMGPADQWDALSSAGKLQILCFVGLLEAWGESSVMLANDGKVHYMRGGTPGYYPRGGPGPLPLFDPFGLSKKSTAEKKEKQLLAEINNGRLAMLGIMGCLSASKGLIVPGLDSLPIKPYAGEIMAPFVESDAGLPLVNLMLQLKDYQI